MSSCFASGDLSRSPRQLERPFESSSHFFSVTAGRLRDAAETQGKGEGSGKTQAQGLGSSSRIAGRSGGKAQGEGWCSSSFGSPPCTSSSPASWALGCHPGCSASRRCGSGAGAQGGPARPNQRSPAWRGCGSSAAGGGTRGGWGCAGASSSCRRGTSSSSQGRPPVGRCTSSSAACQGVRSGGWARRRYGGSDSRFGR